MNVLIKTCVLLLLSVTIVLCAAESSNITDNLLAVVTLFRHGERTIISTYPNDPYKDISNWPGGFGQLTNAGKNRHYRLGQWFRERYDGFIPPKYSLYDIYVRSTDVDRTLMSAESHLAGLYPPTDDEVWNPNILWQPIPVHTVPQELDNVLSVKKPCPKYDRLLRELFNTTYFIKVNEGLKDLYAYLEEHTGEPAGDLRELEHVHGIWTVEDTFNYSLPGWVRSIYPEKTKYWSALSFATAAYTPDLARLGSGTLLNEIIQHFRNVSAYGKNDAYQRYRIYSAHDSTVSRLLTSLNLYNYISPPFASAVIFELRQDDKPFVNIYYKNDTVPVSLVLPGCKFDCVLDDFVELLKPITLSVDQWEIECLDKSDNSGVGVHLV